jgi:hypothetical protein
MYFEDLSPYTDAIPPLIVHYVKAHKYLPPAIFIDAVLES